MTILLTAILLTCGFWFVLCILASNHLARKVPFEASGKYRARRYLGWVRPPTDSPRNMFFFSPVIFLLTVRLEGPALEDAGNLVEEAKRESSSLWQQGRVWLHPEDLALWEAKYMTWWNAEFSQRVSRTMGTAHLGMQYQVTKLKKEAAVCNCPNPTRAKVDKKYAYCPCGHVLPLDAPAIFWQ